MMHSVIALDQSVLDFLYSLRALPVTYFFIGISEFGRYQSILAVSGALSAWFYIRGRYADITGLFVSVLGSGAVILTMKFLVQRPRPAFSYQAYPEGLYYAFPSAHAGLSIAFYGFVAYLIMQSYPTLARNTLSVILPALAILIGFSRLYLGVHYLTDVIAGFVIGALFVSLGVRTRLWILCRSSTKP